MDEDSRIRRRRLPIDVTLLLRRSFLFAELSEDLIQRIARLAQVRRLAAGEILFREGDEADGLYGVISGVIRIGIDDGGSKKFTLNLMEEGDFFGEIALLDGLPRTATAVAMEATELISVGREVFLGLLDREPRLARHIIELLCERLRRNTDQIRDAVFLDVGRRLAKTLVALALGHGVEDGRGGLRIGIKLSQTDLAQMLGVSREAVNKQVNEWVRADLVRLEGGDMVVDVKRLAEVG